MWEKIKIINSSIFAFVLPFLRLMLSRSGPILIAAATQAVAVIAANAGDAEGSVKREMALQMICRQLKMQGIQVGVDVATSLVNAALELAVVKSQQ